MPPLRWGAGLFYRSERFHGRFDFLRYEAQNEISAFETPTPGYTMLNLSLTAVLALLDDRLPVNLSLVARNLLDEKARNSVAFNKDEVLLPGRSFRLSVGATF
jgi:iron complex outermembrane receptor protein